MLLQIISIALLFYSALVAPTPLPTEDPKNCTDPADLDAEWMQLQAKNRQNLIVPIPFTEASNLKQSYDHGQIIMGEKTCPKNSLQLKSSVDASLLQRTTCPYYFVMDIDPKRYPPAITEARCRCSGCLEKSGQSEFQVCEPVTLPVKMLRNTGVCVNGVWKYEPYTHNLPFACTCAVSREQESSIQMTSDPGAEDPPGM